ncbi:Alpha/beta hydrolase fold-3 protein [Roseovarius sp. TM1035]|jgi:acetyl esterase/lipase|uniref:alpha/beta hydrolase fold domain-containing protein n=1 Tax=Roseovarius sp. TM1035 TaxID=391613 RepID=UPI0001557198|nr:alpha/beta hydrolase fold domain-containing protein [Roseovarius sp. TM1035]AWZ18945.1 6-hexanolactone hydrolase [Roseovarius sp. AK1035]EDM33119.1 Alpha/beta hydrolase fold-3 protein [Roseovarius sp. TM1035]
MSWQLRLLNRQLRWFEKPALARHDKDRLRRSFAFKSRLYFHAPFGSSFLRDTLDGVPVQWARARAARPAPVILYFHGGAYVFGTSSTHRAMLAKLSALTGLPACLPDYRLAPEHPFPAQIADALAAYRALRAKQEVIIGGDSAGGGLALALLHEILAQGLAPPLGVFAFSPLTDVTYSGASVTENAARDCVLSASRVGEMLEMFLRGQDPRDPRASPLFGVFSGAPPVWMTVGDTEILRDDTLRMQAALVAQGVQCTLTVAPDHPHVWPIFHNVLPEARSTLRDLAAWISSL